MALTAIFLLSLVSAQNISISYPSEVVYGEKFNVDLSLIDFSDNVYDVKIDITSNEGDRIARIFNGESWQSTYNYVNDAINTLIKNDSSFLLNITEAYQGTANIEIKIRAGTTRTFSGYTLRVISKNQSGNNGVHQDEEENKTEIYLELEHDEEIKNGEEFEVKVRAFGLEDKNYDIKLDIVDENDTIISEIYNEEEDVWKSSNYYINNFFDGAGNKSDNIKLRIKKDYENFKGDAKIQAKIRENGKNDIIDEVEDDIEIKQIEKEEVVAEEKEIDGEEEVETRSIIKLNEPKGIKSAETGVYKSKTQYIKEYAIYGFALFCVFVIIILIIKGKKL